MFGELARTFVLLGLTSGKWLNLAARLKIFIVFEVKKKKKKGMKSFKQWR